MQNNSFFLSIKNDTNFNKKKGVIKHGCKEKEKSKEKEKIGW